MPPVVDCLAQQKVRPLDNPGMFTRDVAFGGNDDPLRVNPQADRAVCERCGLAFAVAFEVHETGRRQRLATLDKAIKRPPQRHQARNSPCPDIGDGPKKSGMHDLTIKRGRAFLEQGIERVQIEYAGIGCQNRRRPSWTFFSNSPLYDSNSKLWDPRSNRN